MVVKGVIGGNIGGHDRLALDPKFLVSHSKSLFHFRYTLIIIFEVAYEVRVKTTNPR